MDKNDREEFDQLTRRVNRLEQSDAEQNAALDRLIFPPRARESDAVQAARLAAHNLSVAQVEAARVARGMTGAHDLTPGQVEALRAERNPDITRRVVTANVELFMLGLRDLREMIDGGRMRENTVDGLDGVLIAGINRIDAMLEAWQREIDAGNKPRE